MKKLNFTNQRFKNAIYMHMNMNMNMNIQETGMAAILAWWFLGLYSVSGLVALFGHLNQYICRCRFASSL